MTTAGDPFHPPRGICSVCGDRVPLTDKGLVRVHLEPHNGEARWGREACAGAGNAPRRER